MNPPDSFSGSSANLPPILQLLPLHGLPDDCPVLNSGCDLFNQLTEAMLMADAASLRILAANPALQILTGYSLRELQQMSLQQLVLAPPEEIRAHCDQLLERRVIEAGPGRIRAKDGSAIEIERSLNLVKLDGHAAICAVYRDIRQRLRLEAAYRQSQKLEALGRLAGGIAHDCNNLLTVILGQLELLFKDPLVAPTARSRLQMIREAALHSAQLTNQLLTFGRKQPIEYQAHDLRPIAQNFALMAQTVLGHDVQFRLKLDPAPCRARVDSSEFGQVIMNLVINARDAMPRGGELELGVTRHEFTAPVAALHDQVPPGSYCVLRLRDTGEGIAPEVLPKIFDPFFTTKGNRGTGLGLSTVYTIVRHCGGAIRVESQPGHGSLFEIILPALPA